MEKLNVVFCLKVLDNLDYFLYVEVTHDLLDKVQLHESKHVSTPMAIGKIRFKHNVNDLANDT